MSNPRSKPKQTISDQKLEKLMQDGYIPGLSVAFISSEKIETHALGVTNSELKSTVNSDTQFWACSLSKPVFAYLVIKLIHQKKLGEDFGLETPLPWDESALGPQADKKPFTVKMILSHMTGLPNQGAPKEDPIFAKSKPGELFRYSGEGYVYLQKFIKKCTGKSLNKLAKEFVFTPLGMTKSSFQYPEDVKNMAYLHSESMEPNLLPQSKMHGNHKHPAASLHTTATDYARFLQACLQDKEFRNLVKTPCVESMEMDIEAKADKAILTPIAWSMGFGLQKDEHNKPSIAFHWGHGCGTRAFFAMNLNPPGSAMVYFANSDNGLAIAEDLSNLSVGDIRPCMNYLSSKYGYKQINFPGWKKYHEYIMLGANAEKAKDFKSAMDAYEQANILRPGNSELEYHMLWCGANRMKPPAPVIETLNTFKGQYGFVKIFVEDSKLKVNPGDSTRDLQYTGNDTFLDGKVILKFDTSATPPTLTCFFPEGGKRELSKMPEAKDKLSTTAHVSEALSISSMKPMIVPLDGNEQKAGRINSEKSITDFSPPSPDSINSTGQEKTDHKDITKRPK